MEDGPACYTSYLPGQSQRDKVYRTRSWGRSPYDGKRSTNLCNEGKVNLNSRYELVLFFHCFFSIEDETSVPHDKQDTRLPIGPALGGAGDREEVDKAELGTLYKQVGFIIFLSLMQLTFSRCITTLS